MKITNSDVPGCYEILPDMRKDERGFFAKTFHLGVFEENGLNTFWAEEYHSLSKRRVLRGLHFQVPPHDHVKLVYCVVGEVMDVVVDLRLGSPTYGQYQMFELSADKANMIYLPRGLAHGFYTLSETVIMMYKVSTVYAPDHDTGILWDSVGIPWPDENPLVSKRDEAFFSFSDFESPFVWRKGGE